MKERTQVKKKRTQVKKTWLAAKKTPSVPAFWCAVMLSRKCVVPFELKKKNKNMRPITYIVLANVCARVDTFHTPKLKE